METPAVVFSVGPLAVTGTVITTWALLAMLWVVAVLLTRRLRIDPGPLQTALEGMVSAQAAAIDSVVPDGSARLLPFIGGLWVFLVSANLLGVVPGLSAPTADLSTTAALAMLVFLASHWYSVRSQGLRGHLRHYLRPSPVLAPFHLISEVTRTVALAVRLFGNIMSLEMVALLVLLVAGFLVPVPILMLHVIEAAVQAYIFGMLALIYLAGAIQFRQLREQGQAQGEA